MGFTLSGPGTPPASAPFATGADNGVGVFGGNVQLGDPYAAFTTVSQLTADRALYMARKFIKWEGAFSGTAFTNIFFNDQNGYLVVENDELNSAVPQTETGFKNRTNPSFAAPFDKSYESFFGQRNTGELFLRARDLNAVPTGGNVIVFESQTIALGVQEMVRMRNLAPGLNTMMVNTTAPLGIVTIENNANTNGVQLMLSNPNNGASATTLIDFINDAGQCFVELLSSGNSPANAFIIDNSTLGGDVILRSLTGSKGELRVISGVGVTINGGTSTGNPLDINGPLNTDAPAGGVTSSGDIQFGGINVTPVVLNNTRYWEVNVSGTVIKVLVGV